MTTLTQGTTTSRWLSSFCFALAVSLTLAMLLLLVSCHPRAIPAGSASSDRMLITQQQIERSGARTAWEALKRLAPQFTFRETRNGQPGGLGRRGRSSILLSDAPLVFVDGAELADFRSLNQIPASTLLSIEILNGIEGTSYYGSNAVSGVILFKTKS